MLLGIVGPYSAKTEIQRALNLQALNKIAALVLDKGHVPIIGVNAVLPVINYLPASQAYDTIMKSSLALISNCDSSS